MLKIIFGIMLVGAGLGIISHAILVFPPSLFTFIFGIFGLGVALLGVCLIFKPSLILISPED